MAAGMSPIKDKQRPGIIHKPMNAALVLLNFPA